MSLLKYVWEKLDNYVYATLEDDQTLRAMMELEQYLGQEIIWVSGKPLDTLIDEKKHLPNPLARWCTTEMKMKPIFEYIIYNSHLGKYVLNYKDIPAEERIKMNIGYRIDDYERVAKFTTHFDYAPAVDSDGKLIWKSNEWRVGNFPVIYNSQPEIIEFWKGKNVNFPELNNCEYCPLRPLELIKQQLQKPNKSAFWINQEKKTGHRFRMDYSLEEIRKMPVNGQFDFTSASICDSGGCTD